MNVFPGIPEFNYLHAQTAEDVQEFLKAHPGQTRFLSGGTDLFPQMREGILEPEFLIDVKEIPGIKEISTSPSTGLTMGAAVTVNQIAADEDIGREFPVLVETALSISSYPLRNRATVGGNLCNGSPGADLAPPLLVLQARLVIQGSDGTREEPLADFFKGPGLTTLCEDEFLYQIIIPPTEEGTVGRYLKLCRNKGGDLAIVGVAVLAYPEEKNASGTGWRLALASVAPTPIRVPPAEKLLNSKPWSDEVLEEAVQLTMQTAQPIDDVRSSAAYRKAMVGTLTRRAVQAVYAEMTREG